MKKSFIKRNTKNAGFTLVETLVAIAILMIAIAGPLTVAEKGLSAAIYARDKLIGSYLAQDGMEAIKNIVDTDQLNSATLNPQGNTNYSWWLSINENPNNLLSGCNSSDYCYIDTTSNLPTITPCNGTALSCHTALSLISSGYVQSGSNPTTPFTRYFYVQPFNTGGGGTDCTQNPPCNATNVVVNVTWPGDVVGGGGVILEDTMFDTPLQ